MTRSVAHTIAVTYNNNRVGCQVPREHQEYTEARATRYNVELSDK